MSGKPRVLVVEDDVEIAGVLRRSLRLEGYEVKLAEDGVAALEESSVFEPDAVVLDLGLPKLDGVEVARRLRDGGDVPILMLTARDSLDDRVSGLDSGADDYLVKPFEREELLARLRALLRRRPPRGSASLVVGDLRLNPDTREVFRGERRIDLTTREFELLEYLMRNERLVVSRETLLDDVWGYAPLAETNTVDVFISNLRRKLEAGGEPRILHTVRGAGYVIRAGEAASDGPAATFSDPLAPRPPPRGAPFRVPPLFRPDDRRVPPPPGQLVVRRRPAAHRHRPVGARARVVGDEQRDAEPRRRRRGAPCDSGRRRTAHRL